MSKVSIVAVAVALAAAGCSSGSSAPPRAGGPCDLTLQGPTMHPGIGMTYAMLSATLVVSSDSSTAKTCTPLRSGDVDRLKVGDRVAFIANQPATLTPNGTDVVTETKLPAQTAHGPGAPLGNHGYLVTLTATHPGQVRVGWFNCGGTAC